MHLSILHIVLRVRFASLSRLFGVMAIVVLASCTSYPELIGIDNPETPVATVNTAKKQKLFLASTREATETVGALYSGRRAPDLGLASMTVSIPPTHQIGSLERPKRLPPDPATEFAVVDPVIYGSDQAFINALNDELRKLPRGKREVLFFVHGYNNTTSDAVLRLAQFANDSGFEGVSVLFDWASAAKLTRYVYDINSALIARPKISELGTIMAKTDAESYSVLAHSMGGFLVMEALKDLSQQGNFDRMGRLQSIILASPDIDMDLFRSQLNQIDDDFDNIFVLLSHDDGALRFSRTIAGGVPRVGAGNINELAQLGVIAIDMTEVKTTGSSAHSKFASSPEIVQLIGAGLQRPHKLNAGERSSTLREILFGIPVTVAFQ